MTLIIRTLFLTILFFVCFSSIATASYSDIEDEKAVMAAEKAVELLGKDKGAILIDAKSVDIVGFVSAISAKSINIEETLKDLNAKMVGMDIQISLSGDILFDFDKWNIKPEAEETLAKIAKITNELKKKNILIEGHTDSKGSSSYNLKLSQKRADSIRNWFVKKGGLSQVKFATKGYGESRAIAPNKKADGSDNPKGRAKNRRVEIRLRK